MAKLNCSGKIDTISSQQFKYICELIEEIGFKSSTIVFETLGEASHNFCSFVKRIVVVNDEGKSFKMIAKFAPTQTHIRLGNTSSLFLN